MEVHVGRLLPDKEGRRDTEANEGWKKIVGQMKAKAEKE